MRGTPVVALLTRFFIVAAVAGGIAGCKGRIDQRELTPEMSDEVILRTIGFQPATLQSERLRDTDDELVTVYTNQSIRIEITRSLGGTGLHVVQSLSGNKKHEWILGKP